MDPGSMHTGRAVGSSSPQTTYDTSIGSRMPARQHSGDHPDSGSRHRRWQSPAMKRAAAAAAAAASPYEYRSDEEDVLNSRIGIYGWRKRCLYLFEVCVAVIAILNLALLAWMSRIMDFSVDGMGTMRIHDDRVTMQGRSEFVSSLFAQSITSEQNEALRLLSNQGINITAGDTYFLLGSKRVEAHAERFEIRDSSGTAYFVVTPSHLTTSVESIILNSSRGATFQDFIQTKQLRGQAGSTLQVMSPSADMTLLSGGKLNVMASGSGIAITSPHVISLNAGSGNISMDTSNLLLPKLATITSSPSSSAIAANVYEVCVCSGSGKLFLVSAQVPGSRNSSNSSPCLAGAGVSCDEFTSKHLAMDLSLSQVEYTEAGAVVGRGCVHVVPGSPSKTGQKVAVGNNLGELRLFGIHQRTRAVEDTFKISAFPHTPVNCMRVMQIPDSDKVAIFVGGQAAVGTCGDVLAFSRRNKSPFLDFTTHLTDPVAHLDLYQHDMFAASANMFTHFYNCEVDHGFYAPPHSITDVSYASLDGVIHPMIISKDRLLRILSYDVDASQGYGQKETIFEVELPSQPQCLLPYCEPGQPRKNMLYGTKDGRLGMTAISRPIKQRFCLDNDKKKGSIDTLATFDLDEDGVSEIVVGRSDGRVDVFRVERGESKPTLCAEHSFAESVTAVSCGNVGSAEEHEVVLSTYSGRIFGLRTGTSTSLAQASVPKEGAEVAGDHANRVAALRQQISDLELEVTEKRARREDDQEKAVDGVEYIADPYIELHDDFSFQESEATYVLTIEAQVSLDFLILRSDTTMDVVDLDKNTILSSQCTPDPENRTMVAYTFRCQLNTRRVELKIRPIEGQQGTLSVMVAPAAPMSLYKVAKELNYEIRPLCLHCLVHMDDIDRPLSSLTYVGAASLDDIHGMVYKCLARLGERPNRTNDGEAISLIYTSAITGTVVRITYKDNELLLESDNISTLSIFKEYLTKLILEKRLRFTCTPDIKLESATWMLQLIHEKVCPQLALSQKLLLWQALKEVELSEGTGSVTSPEYKDILENGESLQKEAEVAASNSMLERLYGTITDLYIDYYRMEGVDSKKHINVLVQLLDQYDLDRLLEFFLKDPNDPEVWGEE